LENNPTDLEAYSSLTIEVANRFGNSVLKEYWDPVIHEAFTNQGSPHYFFLKKYYDYNSLTSSEINKRMEKLLVKTKELFKIDGITAADHFHMGLVKIHPWSDANGRVARLGLNLLLIKSGYPAIAFTSNEHYTSAINAFNSGDKTAFKNYIQEEICHATRIYSNPEFREGKPFEELVEKCKITSCEKEFDKLRKYFGVSD